MKDKKTLYTIIGLLIIFLPLSIYGTVMQIINGQIIIDDNPNKEYILNNKVYFYQDGNLLKTYECKGTCTKVKTVIDDEIYNINYYKEGTKEVPTILNNDYALFNEGDKNILYNITLDNVFLQFDELKTYNVDHTNPILIVKNSGRYAVLAATNMQVLIPYKYSYLAIANRLKDGVLDTSKFIAKDDNNYWYVLENGEPVNNIPFRETIVDFNNTYIITSPNGKDYFIYDYDQKGYLQSYIIEKAYCLEEYLLIVYTNEESKTFVSIYTNAAEEAIYNLELPKYEKIDFKYNKPNIEVYLDENLYQSIVLN